MGVEEHRKHAPESVSFAVITVSDTRTEADDKTGHLIRQMLADEGHREGLYLVVQDKVEEIRGAIRKALEGDVDVVVLDGGTGISKRDVTLEALEPLLEKELPGFGELFRGLSFKEIGPAAMLSRAVAGTSRGRLVIALPGSAAAARLAMEKLVLPELGHLVWEVRK